MEIKLLESPWWNLSLVYVYFRSLSYYNAHSLPVFFSTIQSHANRAFSFISFITINDWEFIQFTFQWVFSLHVNCYPCSFRRWAWKIFAKRRISLVLLRSEDAPSKTIAICIWNFLLFHLLKVMLLPRYVFLLLTACTCTCINTCTLYIYKYVQSMHQISLFIIIDFSIALFRVIFNLNLSTGKPEGNFFTRRYNVRHFELRIKIFSQIT